MADDTETEPTITPEEFVRLRDRHALHELAPAGRAEMEDRMLSARKSLAGEHENLLFESVVNAVEAGHFHLVELPLVELLQNVGEGIKWALLVYIAARGYRPAQLEVSARCAAEAAVMVAIHDTVRGRTLDEVTQRLATRALGDAEAMIGHAVGWGALAHGTASESRTGTPGLTAHPKELGFEVTAALWAGFSASARKKALNDGYEERFFAASGRKEGNPLRSGTDIDPNGPATSSERVVVPHANLNRDDRKQWGIEAIQGKPLPLIRGSALVDVRQTLLAAHPHLRIAVERILGDLSEDRPISIRPTVLVGPPGAGKSRLCRDLLSALRIPFAPIDAATTADQSIVGSPRRWSSAYPSVPLRLFIEHNVANPCILIDELDKAGRSSAGAIHDPLLSLLEPLSSTKWRDLFLDAEIDVSRIVWLFTANTVTGIPGPLRSRLRVLSVPLPSQKHVPALADRIRLDILLTNELDPNMESPLDGEELTALVKAFGREGSLRDLRRYVEHLLKLRGVDALHH